MPSTTKADTANELSQLGAAIERIADNRQNAEQELATIDHDTAEALVLDAEDADGSFIAAGKLEQRKLDLSEPSRRPLL